MRLSINCVRSLLHFHIAMSLYGKTALCLCLLFAAAFAGEGCDKSQCKGPVKYYEELNCKPVYAKPNDCCAVRYDCSHLEGRSPQKCYANGHEYSVGEDLRDEDRSSRCIVGCKCSVFDDKASFLCPGTDCAFPPPNGACYMKKDVGCCPTQYCPKEGEVVATCKVGNKTYRDGEAFYPKDRPDLSHCVCKEGFKGELVEPFCKKLMCDTEMRGSTQIQEKCSPIYYHGQSAVTGCSINFRCQNDKDKVIKASGEDKSDEKSSEEQSSDMKCVFGNMTMNIGDELNQGTGYDSMCVKCICEVPPTPTCRQLGSDECQTSFIQDI